MELRTALLEILDRAIAATGAARGDIQLFNRRLGGLEIEAQRGFDADFLDLFKLVRPSDPSSCARAFSLGTRVTIADVQEDRAFVSYRSVAARSGFRSVQSTPIRARGVVCGVLSTHFAQPGALNAFWESLLDDCAQQAGNALERLAALRPDVQPA